MIRLTPRAQFLAICLAAVAGYVDAIGFLELGGFFVSFMSGNSTRLGIALYSDVQAAMIVAGLILLFVAGAGVGSAIGRAAPRRRPVAVLMFVSALLLASSVLAHAGSTAPAIVAIVLAMGAENAVFQEGEEVRVGLTYMTGALVKLGQSLAAIPFGGDPAAWLPHLLLWAGLVMGASAGAYAYPHTGLAGVWIAGAVVAALTFLALPLARQPTDSKASLR